MPSKWVLKFYPALRLASLEKFSTNLGLKTELVSEGNFPLDHLGT